MTPEDVKSIGMDVLRHRIIVTYEAEAENITAEDIVQKIFDRVDGPWNYTPRETYDPAGSASESTAD